MIKSMTAFGRAKTEGVERDVTVEIRSVNSRFFDCTVKMPRVYAFLEEKIKNHIQKTSIARAKVDVFITVDEHETKNARVLLDTAYAAAYIDALRTLRDRFDLPDDITTMAVAKNSDIFTTKRADVDADAVFAMLLPTIDAALTDYRTMREAEGEKIERDLKTKIANVRAFAAEVEAISAEDTVTYRERLESRLRSALSDNRVTLDENRILTECAIWADKIAIDEEIVRLRAHFDAFNEIAALPEPSGRKLDFLMQEMNRETNTIGSKANNARIARIVVNMKGELEKMREQIQNVE